MPVARVVHQPDDGEGEQREDDAARRVEDLVVEEDVVVGAEDLAQHEVRECEHIQRDGDEVGDVAAELARDEGRDVEDDDGRRALEDVVDGDV